MLHLKIISAALIRGRRSLKKNDLKCDAHSRAALNRGGGGGEGGGARSNEYIRYRQNIVFLIFSRGRQWQALPVHSNHQFSSWFTCHGHIHRGIGLAARQSDWNAGRLSDWFIISCSEIRHGIYLRESRVWRGGHAASVCFHELYVLW